VCGHPDCKVELGLIGRQTSYREGALNPSSEGPKCRELLLSTERTPALHAAQHISGMGVQAAAGDKRSDLSGPMSHELRQMVHGLGLGNYERAQSFGSGCLEVIALSIRSAPPLELRSRSILPQGPGPGPDVWSGESRGNSGTTRSIGGEGGV